MRIAMMGCGAMGTVVGAYLTKAGCQVDLIDQYEEHIQKMRSQGAHITGTVDFTVPVSAMLPGEMQGIYDLVFLLTKQTTNPAVLKNLSQHLNGNSIVCTLQNGVPEPSVAEIIGEGRTIGGTVLWGATFIAPGVSQVTQDLSRNDHLFEIGEIHGEISERIRRVAAVLEGMGPVKITSSLMASRWGKLINNACMSGMSAVCGATFGEVLDNTQARACLSYIGKEVKLCCEASGYSLPLLLHDQVPDTLDLSDQEMFDQNQKMFMDMYSDMRDAKASMLQDLEKGRMTEVRMINGYVSQVGDRYGIDTPFNDKVVEIVSKIEAGELPLSMDNVALFSEKGFIF